MSSRRYKPSTKSRRSQQALSIYILSKHSNVVVHEKVNHDPTLVLDISHHTCLLQCLDYLSRYTRTSIQLFKTRQ